MDLMKIASLKNCFIVNNKDDGSRTTRTCANNTK